uniref:Reverse transcriptase RNase H-like domain-containing protein n=1 Tax=Nicotiana tabacum TaxID=4097 RepID=A0A1S3YQJ4_TOBAC
MPVPYADMLLMMGANGTKPRIIPCIPMKMAVENISALQLKKGVKRKEPTFLATLCIEDVERSSGPIPEPVKELLLEFEDVMPQDMPERLPPRCTVDHEIELVPGAKPPAWAPYRMSQSELIELRRQLTEMLDTGIIVPSKSPYESPVLFQKKHDDASDYTLGGVLLQEGHPVAYESRKLKDAEQRYAAHEKELLAVVHCLRLWRHYLLGTPFVVNTDNTA